MSRVDKLLVLLTQRTIEGKVSWQETDFEDTYEASFNNHSVRLTPLVNRVETLATVASSLQRMYKQQDRDVPHVLEIYDAQDRLVEEIGKLKSDPLLGDVVYGATNLNMEDPNWKYPIQELYEVVRKQFDEPNIAIDALIEELE